MILYSSPTCPRCKVLAMKLDKKKINYVKEIDEEKILKRGLKSIPWLEFDDGDLMDFSSAIDWINKQEVNE